MKNILIILLFGSLSSVAQSQRLQVSGQLQSDSLSTSSIKLLGTNSTKLIRSNGQPISLGTNLSLANGALSLLGASGHSKALVKTNSGNQFRLIEGPQTDSLAIPYASATSEGLLTTRRQFIGGPKTFGDGFYLRPGARIQFAGTNNDTLWSIRKDNNSDLLIRSTTTSSFLMKKTGGLDIPRRLYVDGIIESAVGFKDNRNNSNILMADGSLAKYTLSNGFIHVAGTATTFKGIGVKTSMPQALFHINGTGYLSNDIFRVNSNGSVALAVNSTNEGWTGLTINRANDEKWFIGMSGVPSNISPRPAASTQLFFNGTANVGVANESPAEKLHVNGNIKATGFAISGGTGNQIINTNGGVILAGTNMSLINYLLTPTLPLSSIYSYTTNNQVPSNNLNITDSQEYIFISFANVYPSFPSPYLYKGRRWVIKNLTGSSIRVGFPSSNSFVQNNGSTDSSIYTLGAYRTTVFFCSGTKFYIEAEI